MHISCDLLPEKRRSSLPSAGEALGFGRLRTDHVFLMDYMEGEWRNQRIVPYGDIVLKPGSLCLHYGQTIFEGIKAFRQGGEIYIFRGDKNAERLNRSARTLCMPEIPVADQLEALYRLADIERNWCPAEPESSLYIRPFMFATEDALAVHPSSSYTFCIMLSPSGPYYSGGFSKAIRLLVSKEFHRAAPGGTGAAKAGGNYAASLRASAAASAKDAQQVLFLSTDNEFVEEAGAMNHFHVEADGTFVIPEFSDTILESITSLSVLELAKAGKIKARQEKIRLADFLEGIKSGKIIEAGGFGTAAVISPVGRYLLEDGTEYVVGDGEVGPHSRALYELYSSIQTGKTPAPAGWLLQVPHY